MKIALAQMKMSPSMEKNFEKTKALIMEAGEKGADLICFPEVQLSPFFAQYKGRSADSYAVSLEDSYVREVCDLCRKLKIYASPNFYIEEDGKKYDMSLLIDDKGEIIGKQKMVHVAQCEHFYEQDYYTPSEEGFQVFDTQLGRIGIVVCFDRHYPESIRTEALHGAELIIIPTANTSAEPSELFQWEVRIQAFQSSTNIAMCNRVGTEDEMEFNGESLVTDYNGNAIACASSGEQLLIAEVDLPAATQAREQKPYTRYRRPKLYE